jgi:hypothetical protein
MISRIVRLVHPIKAVAYTTAPFIHMPKLTNHLRFSFAEDNKKPTPSSIKEESIET